MLFYAKSTNWIWDCLVKVTMVENSLKMSHKESELDFLAGFCNSVLHFFLGRQWRQTFTILSSFQVNKKEVQSTFYCPEHRTTTSVTSKFKFPYWGLWGEFTLYFIPRHQLVCPKFYESREDTEGEKKAQIALERAPKIVVDLQLVPKRTFGHFLR